MSLENFIENKSNIINSFALSKGDTGSSSVQIALLTERIKYLTEHMIANPKDLSARLSLLILVAKRTKLLKYLKSKDLKEYELVTDKLGLKKK